MKTVKQKFIDILISMGMSDTQANEVMDIAIPQLNGIVENYSITWNSSADGYPDVIYNVLMLSIKPIALKWINDNTPLAWFKPMFE